MLKKKTKAERRAYKVKKKKAKTEKLRKEFTINNKVNYHKYLHSPIWRGLKRKKLKSTHNKCERCDKKAWQVHHKHYKTLGHEKFEDLESLCGTCHMDEHNIPTELDNEYLEIIK